MILRYSLYCLFVSLSIQQLPIFHPIDRRSLANSWGYDSPHSIVRLKRDVEEEHDRLISDNFGENDAESSDSNDGGVYGYLYKRMKEDAERLKRQQRKQNRRRPVPNVYTIPGPQEPLPGRSHLGDYWPVFPFQNQYSGGLDLDPSISRHIGGDLNLAVPSWGMLDIYGRYFNRIRDTTTKFGYMNYPVNMLDLDKQDFVRLMTDPSLHWNRNQHPTLPLGKLGRSYVPISCKPPLCNPYQHTFGVGVEHDYGGLDGQEGDIDIPIPISKGVAYRVPISGKIYYAFDNITMSYGQNLNPIDPLHSMFDYQYNRDPNLAIPRQRRHVSSSEQMISQRPSTKSLDEYVVEPKERNGKPYPYSPMSPLQMPFESSMSLISMIGDQYRQGAIRRRRAGSSFYEMPFEYVPFYNTGLYLL